MVSSRIVNQAGTKDAPFKTRDTKKVRIQVALTAKADGTKLNPFIVSAGAKRESKTKILYRDFKSQCSVVSSTNEWMNEYLTMRWINKIVGRFAFSKGLLSWDSYESHLTDPLKNLLTEMNNKSVIVTEGCTNYI